MSSDEEPDPWRSNNTDLIGLQEETNLRLLLRALDITPGEFREAEAQGRAEQAVLKITGATPCDLCQSEAAVRNPDIGDGEVMALGASCDDALGGRSVRPLGTAQNNHI